MIPYTSILYSSSTYIVIYVILSLGLAYGDLMYMLSSHEKQMNMTREEIEIVTLPRRLSLYDLVEGYWNLTVSNETFGIYQDNGALVDILMEFVKFHGGGHFQAVHPEDVQVSIYVLRQKPQTNQFLD